MCCNAADPPAADPRQGEALQRQTALAEKMGDYAIESDKRNQFRLEAQDIRSATMSAQYMRQADQAASRAEDQWNFYVNEGRPMVQQAYNDAKSFDGEGALAGLRGKASADVEQAFAAQQQGTQRALQRAGVNPGSNRAIAAMGAGGANAALAKVSTANSMTENRKLQAVGLRQQAANMANGLPASSIAQSQLGNQSMSGAGALNAQGMQSALAMQNGTMNGFNSSAQAFGGVAQGFGAMRNQELSAWNASNAAQAQESAGYGQAAGAAASAYLGYLAFAASDPATKQNVSRLGVRPDGLNIYSFEYKPEYQAAWGEGTHVGLMATEVQKLYPDAVVRHPDGYLMVDYSKVM